MSSAKPSGYEKVKDAANILNWKRENPVVGKMCMCLYVCVCPRVCEHRLVLTADILRALVGVYAYDDQ